MQEIIGIILRLSILYVYILVILRLTGKRSIGAITPLDFLVALVVGDLFDNVFWGTSPLSSGLVAIVVILALHTLISALSYSSRKIDIVLNGVPVRVVHNGRFDRDGMANQRTSEDEVRAALRLRGEENLTEVREAFWEPSGRMSVLKKANAKNAQKKDRDAVRDTLR